MLRNVFWLQNDYLFQTHWQYKKRYIEFSVQLITRDFVTMEKVWRRGTCRLQAFLFVSVFNRRKTRMRTKIARCAETRLAGTRRMQLTTFAGTSVFSFLHERECPKEHAPADACLKLWYNLLSWCLHAWYFRKSYRLNSSTTPCGGRVRYPSAPLKYKRNWKLPFPY